jgi:hypothetical protein
MLSLGSNDPGCNLVILDPSGKIEFFRRLNEHCVDFRPHLVNGDTYYSYSVPRGPYVAGPRVILDKDLNQVRYIKGKFDAHEFILISLDHYLTLEIDVDRFPSGDRFANSRVREYKEGKLVFDWGTSDYLSQFKNALTASAYPYHDSGLVPSPLHLNSLQIIDEENILVSLGNNGIGLLNKKTKKLSWVLGGNQDQFGLAAQQNLIFIHTPIFYPKENRLIVFLNFSLAAQREGVTKILEYVLDIPERRLKSFRVIKATTEMAFQAGSLQEHGDGVLSIGMGFRILGKNDFIEVAKSGTENFSLRFAGNYISAYRFYRSPFGERLK